MQILAILAAFVAAAAATPVDVDLEARQAAPATCPDWGTGSGGNKILGPTDAKASRCCVYGESIELCCRNDPALATDPHWSQALECSSPWWANATVYGKFYTCNVGTDKVCTDLCADVPYVHGTKPCNK